MRILKTFVTAFLFLCLLKTELRAQSYSIDWFKVASGGGSSAGTNGGSVFAVSGTIGQSDAGSTLTGGKFSLTGGYWSVAAVIQSVNSPLLTILHSGGNVVVSWPSSATGLTLQQSTNLAGKYWTPSTNIVTTANGTNSVTVAPAKGYLFFRLINP